MLDELIVGVATQVVQTMSTDAWAWAKAAIGHLFQRHGADMASAERELENSRTRLSATSQYERPGAERSEIAMLVARLRHALEGAPEAHRELEVLRTGLSAQLDASISAIHQSGSAGRHQVNQSATNGGININAGRNFRIR